MNVKTLFPLLSILFFYTALSNAQVVTSDPAVPIANEPVTIYFDATQGTGGLKDYAGDVYAHTGVLTDQSTSGSDWKYVKTDWGVNTPETKMTRISNNLYKLDIGPDIRQYYGVPPTEKITHMAFVFRSDYPYSGSTYYEGKETGGLDIFVEVFEPGLNITITTPDNPYVILNLNDSLPISVSATLADSVSLYVNDTYVKHGIDSTLLTDTLVADTYGSFWVKAIAWSGSEFVADSFFYFVRQAPDIESLPAGMKDGINYTSDTSVTLVLFAPYKDHVFVLGDFTDWIPQQHGYMKITPDNQRYWITFNDLTPGKKYRYQYLINDSLLIADPYTEMVLDPWNDPFISSTTYPDLLPYPTDTTTGIVSTLQPGQQPYVWHDSGFAPPDKQDLVIYELLIRDFVATHDYKTLIDTLGYFKQLGINAIELMPINEFEGNESWGYNPSFYFAPDKYYGPSSDLRAFVDSCHRRGIAVIQDMVLNHSYGQSPLVQMYFDPGTGQVTAQNPWYNVTSPNPTYSWGYDFNHESPATKAFVDRVTRFWLEQYHIDGYRFDFTKGFTNTPGEGWAKDTARIAILERMADSIWVAKPDAILILEHFTENAEEQILSDYNLLLWGNANCSFGQASMGYASGPCGTWDYSWGSYKNRGWSNPGLVTYMESHDEERIMYENLTYGNSAGTYSVKNLNTALKRIEMSGLMLMTIPGPKMIWQFEELGYDISIDSPCRVCNKPIHWDYYDETFRRRLYQVFASLFKLKREQTVFDTDDYSVAASGPVKYNILHHADMDMVAIGNFDVIPQAITITFPATGTWYEYFSGDSLVLDTNNKEIALEPGDYRLYTTVRLAAPDITAGINITDTPYSTTDINVYPNPSNGTFNLRFESRQPQEITIYFYNAQGKLILNKHFPAFIGENDFSIDVREGGVNGIKHGLYLLQVHSSDRTYSKKIIIE